MFKEFKEFAMKGNVIVLAVGLIIGGARPDGDSTWKHWDTSFTIRS
jgi:hypothetical protein